MNKQNKARLKPSNNFNINKLMNSVSDYSRIICSLKKSFRKCTAFAPLLCIAFAPLLLSRFLRDIVLIMHSAAFQCAISQLVLSNI